MELDRADDYLIDDSGMGSDGELRRAIEILCELPPTSGVQMGDVYIGDGAIQQMDSSNGVDLGIIYGGSCNLEQTNSGNMGLAYQDACTVECTNAGARAIDEDCSRSKSKACREKLRRDKLNDRFLELSSALEPGRPPKSDKASILSDAARVLEQLKADAQELKIANEKLQETIKDLKAEKNELRDEKTRLKEEKEKLEQQVKSMSMPLPVGYMPHPVVIHPCAMAPGFSPGAPSPANKPGPFAAFPSVPMWQWMPSAFVDTTQDAKLWPPNA